MYACVYESGALCAPRIDNITSKPSQGILLNKNTLIRIVTNLNVM